MDFTAAYINLKSSKLVHNLGIEKIFKVTYLSCIFFKYHTDVILLLPYILAAFIFNLTYILSPYFQNPVSRGLAMVSIWYG